MSDRKAVIKNADMSEDMQQDAVDCATQAMEKYNIEKDIAAYIKKGSRLPLQDSPSDFLPALSRKPEFHLWEAPLPAMIPVPVVLLWIHLWRDGKALSRLEGRS
ncbi:dynein light chain 2, cytoplasmic isoform 3-T12 [Amazona ochrocephala]